MPDVLVVDRDEPRFSALVAAQEAEVMARYGADDAGPGLGPGALCLLAVVDGEPAGCVALAPFAPGVGEVKRMYVAPSHRGRRLATALLEEVEGRALATGLRSVQLVTGTEQPEALAVYRRAGYRPIERYGHYADDPATLCFEKVLAAVDAAP